MDLSVPIDQWQLNLPQILLLLGLAQCMYILLYLWFRSGSIKSAFVPSLYFATLGGAFLFDFTSDYAGMPVAGYDMARWTLWFFGPPLSVLLVIQISRVDRVPQLRDFWVVLVVPVAFILALIVSSQDPECSLPTYCPVLPDWLIVAGLLAGLSSMFALWLGREMVDSLGARKDAKDRYWLIIALIVLNLVFLGSMLLSLTPGLDENEALMVRAVAGLGFVYIAGTSLFRIYPQAVYIRPSPADIPLSSAEEEIAARIGQLLDLDKIYHEPSYGRADLARELDIAETMLSRIINKHYGKSLPQLLNERRVEDAKRLLKETDAPMKVVADEVGFNSLASFNRVFRKMTGQTPSAYRSGPAGAGG